MLYPSRIIGKLEEGRSVTSVAAEFRNCSHHHFMTLEQFQTTGTAIRGSVVVFHEEPHPQMNGTSVLQARRNRRQTAGEIARHTTQATGRPISRFTVAEDCTVVVCLHDALYQVCSFNACPSEKGVLCGAGNTRIGGQLMGTSTLYR
ncbi:hypothetical protein TNCV_1420111 [Trichonephila clavipes]|nr:hypothetical protein TNCV_1420111 [Trichonephila clavipes]